MINFTDFSESGRVFATNVTAYSSTLFVTGSLESTFWNLIISSPVKIGFSFILFDTVVFFTISNSSSYDGYLSNMLKINLYRWINSWLNFCNFS